jgi:glucan phosphoethanolaminetransferase (alkaline phosphatase superfamily)
MRALSLFLVFALAKIFALAGHPIPRSPWTPIAYFWQDAAAAILFAAMLFAVQDRLRPRVAHILYWLLVAYATLNIPVIRAVSTPLTWPMLRAARGPLTDSFRIYVTPMNALLAALTLGAAAVFPVLLRRAPQRVFATAAVIALAVIALGPMASARVETIGLDRNVLAVLVTPSSLSRQPAENKPPADWRVSPFENHSKYVEDLSSLRGVAKNRNVVMISLESTGAQYLSLGGTAPTADPMPNLSALASDGLVFRNAYAVYPESIKGLMCSLCSIWPSFDSSPEAYEKAPCRSVATILGDAGYRTALFHSGRFAYLGMESVIHNRGYQVLEDAGDIGGNHESSFGVDEPSTVARILAWLDGLPHGQRFFLTYLPIAGHHPYETPQRGPFPERDELGRYRNALHYGDESLGALLAGLRARGLLADTLLVIYGDHGEAFGQHDGNFGHTFFVYEENVHVPLVIATPGIPTRSVNKAASLVDLPPTILDLLGIAPPHDYQGHTLLDAAPHMALFFTDYSLPWLGLRDGRWKFLDETGSGRTRLVDLERDPAESADLSSTQPARVEWYKQQLRAWSAWQRGYVATFQPPR